MGVWKLNYPATGGLQNGGRGRKRGQDRGTYPYDLLRWMLSGVPALWPDSRVVRIWSLKLARFQSQNCQLKKPETCIFTRWTQIHYFVAIVFCSQQGMTVCQIHAWMVASALILPMAFFVFVLINLLEPHAIYVSINALDMLLSSFSLLDILCHHFFLFDSHMQYVKLSHCFWTVPFFFSLPSGSDFLILLFALSYVTFI